MENLSLLLHVVTAEFGLSCIGFEVGCYKPDYNFSDKAVFGSQFCFHFVSIIANTNDTINL